VVWQDLTQLYYNWGQDPHKFKMNIFKRTYKMRLRLLSALTSQFGLKTFLTALNVFTFQDAPSSWVYSARCSQRIWPFRHVVGSNWNSQNRISRSPLFLGSQRCHSKNKYIFCFYINKTTSLQRSIAFTLLFGEKVNQFLSSTLYLILFYPANMCCLGLPSKHNLPRQLSVLRSL
jgi:hypothetical protein